MERHPGWGGAAENRNGSTTTWKIIVGKQNPDSWYGPYAPNCTDPGANGAHPENCEGGCLYNLDTDYTEHHNLKAQQPRIYALLAARLDGEEGVGVWAEEAAVAAVRDPAREGLYDDYVLQQRDPGLDVAAAAAAAAAAATSEAVAPSPPHTGSGS